MLVQQWEIRAFRLNSRLLKCSYFQDFQALLPKSSRLTYPKPHHWKLCSAELAKPEVANADLANSEFCITEPPNQDLLNTELPRARKIRCATKVENSRKARGIA